MKHKWFWCTVLLTLMLTNCAKASLAPKVTPPALPTYVEPTQPSRPETSAQLNPGEAVTVTNGTRYAWIQYLGSVSGYDSWQCVTNESNRGPDCFQRDAEVHNNYFYWNEELFAVSSDSTGRLSLLDGWFVTTLPSGS